MLFDGKATSALVGNRPMCDFDHDSPTPAAVDAATTVGGWAYMCESHHRQYGRGLGEGVGQVLLCDDNLDFTLKRNYGLL